MAAAVQRTSSSELPRARTGANRQSPAEDQHLLSSSLSGNTISTADFINKRQTEYCTLPRYRPRSATLQVTNQIRRSLRGLSRSRPATARSGRPNAHSYDELRREASLQKVDNAFARIKEQLVSTPCMLIHAPPLPRFVLSSSILVMSGNISHFS